MVTLPRLLEKIDRERPDLVGEETLADVFNQSANFSLVQLPTRKEIRVVDRDTIPARNSLVSVIVQSQYDANLLALRDRFPQLS